LLFALYPWFFHFTFKANIATKEQWRCFFTAITRNLKTPLAFQT